jgi:hypothetical protein
MTRFPTTACNKDISSPGSESGSDIAISEASSLEREDERRRDRKIRQANRMECDEHVGCESESDGRVFMTDRSRLPEEEGRSIDPPKSTNEMKSM